MAKGNTNINPIEEARRYAREVIDQAHETAIEADEPTKGMYEFDAIVIDDEECDVAEIVIMYDDDTERYALVERPRPNAALIREAEKEMRIGDLLQQIELKVMMLSMACETEEELAAAWAAVTATASSSMRIRLHEVGGDGCSRSTASCSSTRNSRLDSVGTRSGLAHSRSGRARFMQRGRRLAGHDRELDHVELMHVVAGAAVIVVVLPLPPRRAGRTANAPGKTPRSSPSRPDRGCRRRR